MTTRYTTIVITPEGHGREINPLSIPNPLSPLFYQQRKAYQDAEAALRTMPVKFDHVSFLDDGKKPGTRWLAHEVNGKWVIVRRAEG